MRFEFHILHGARLRGPLSFAELQYLWDVGQVDDKTLCRHEGCDEWRPLTEVVQPLVLVPTRAGTDQSPPGVNHGASSAVPVAADKPRQSLVCLGAIIEVHDDHLSIRPSPIPGFNSNEPKLQTIRFDEISEITLVDAGDEDSGCLQFSLRPSGDFRVGSTVPPLITRKLLFAGVENNAIARKILTHIQTAAAAAAAEMRRAATYQTLRALDASELDERVNDAIAEGWQPQGGGFVLDGVVCQTMVRNAVA